MQENEFEKKIQAKMEGFELVPGADVWKQVSARIEGGKKRRRVLLYWFFTGFLLLAGSAGWFLTGDRTRSVATNSNHVPNTSSAPENLAREQQKPAAASVRADPNLTPDLQKASDVKPGEKTLVKKELLVANKHKSLLKDLPADINKTEKNLALAKTSTRTAAETVNKNNFSSTTSSATLQSPASTSSLPPVSNAKEENVVFQPTDTALQAIAEKGTLKAAKDTQTLAKLKIAQPGKKNNQKRAKFTFGVTAFAGVSDNVSGFPIRFAKSSQPSNMQWPSNSQSGGVATSLVPLTYKSGFSFGMGVYSSLQLTPRTGLSIGLDYHHYTTKSTVGTRSASRNAFFDATLNQFVSADLYDNGSSTTYANTYRTIEFPVNFTFRLSRNENRPFLLTAGLAPGYNIRSDALYASNSARAYYVTKDQFRRYQLSAQAGFQYTLVSSGKIAISAGPVLHYGLAGLAKDANIAGRQHLFFTGFKTNISLR